MAEYILKINPRDIFIKENAIEYSTVVDNYTESFSKLSTMDLLLQDYSFTDDLIEIIHFVYENWFLVPILKECPVQIRNIFGKNINLLLELFYDPEEEAENIELFIVVRPNMKLDEALSKFDLLLTNWFNSVQHKTKGLLNITIESKDEF